MAKLVKFAQTDGKIAYVNSETVRAIVPEGSNSTIIFGEGPAGKVTVQGGPEAVAAKMVG